MLSNKTLPILSGVASDERRTNNSLSSAAMIAANDDLLLDILLRLPVRSLLVFKSVSKRWLSLISDPYFVNKHCRLHKTRPPRSIPGLFLNKLEFLRYPEIDFIFLDGNVTGVPFKFQNFVNDPRGITIQQSCNGLLCCSSFRGIASDRTYYVYNPSTKHYTTLPRSQNRETTRVNALFKSPVCSISLAFEPLKSPHYKAISVLHHQEEEDVYRIEIYSSETASWKLSVDAFPAIHDIFSQSGVFWNGSVHWMSCRSDSLYFDADRELLKTMPIPPRPYDSWKNWHTMYFGEFNGHLHLIEGCGTQTKRFDILEMETDYSVWNVKYRVDLDTLIIACPEMVRDQDYYVEFSILLVVDEEEKELSSLVLKIPDKVISYNLKEMTFKKIHDILPGLYVKAVQYNWSSCEGSAV